MELRRPACLMSDSILHAETDINYSVQAASLNRQGPARTMTCNRRGGAVSGAQNSLRPLHNYIKPAIMSYRRRPVSSIIKHFLDAGFHRHDE